MPTDSQIIQAELARRELESISGIGFNTMGSTYYLTATADGYPVLQQAS